MNKGIFAIFFVVAVLSISFPVNAQKTAQRVRTSWNIITG